MLVLQGLVLCVMVVDERRGCDILQKAGQQGEIKSIGACECINAGKIRRASRTPIRQGNHHLSAGHEGRGSKPGGFKDKKGTLYAFSNVESARA